MEEGALKRIETAAKKVAEEMGYELCAVRSYREDGTDFVEVSVDKDYAISLDQIVLFSDALSSALDGLDLPDEPFTLDVASPGAERAFPKEDLTKVVGRYVALQAEGFPEGEVEGILENFDGSTAVLKRYVKGRKKVYRVPVRSVARCRFAIKA